MLCNSNNNVPKNLLFNGLRNIKSTSFTLAGVQVLNKLSSNYLIDRLIIGCGYFYPTIFINPPHLHNTSFHKLHYRIRMISFW